VIAQYENEFGNVYDEGMDEVISVDDETETTTAEKEPEADILLPNAFQELDTVNRIKIYQRICSLKRPLLSPPLVTSKRSIYNELNVIVCHVTIRSYTSLMIGLHVGQRISDRPGIEPSWDEQKFTLLP
jgi:hypothetical protein